MKLQIINGRELFDWSSTMEQAPRQSPSSGLLQDLSFDINESADGNSTEIQEREAMLVSLADQVTASSRRNDLESFEVSILKRVNERQSKEVESRARALKNRRANLKKQQATLTALEEDHSQLKAEYDTALSDLKSIQHSIAEAYRRAEKHLPKVHARSSETEDADGAEVSHDNSEKLSAIRAIHRANAAIAGLRFRIARGNFTQIIPQAEKSIIQLQQRNLDESLNYYQTLLNAVNDRLTKAKDQISDVVDSVAFAEKMAISVEEEIDGFSRQLNRSRTEYFSFEAIKEYQLLRTLNTSNIQRRHDLDQRQRQIERLYRHRAKRLAHDGPKSPTRAALLAEMSRRSADKSASSTHSPSISARVSASPSMTPSMSRSYRSGSDRRQVRLDREARTLDQTEGQFKAEKEESESEWNKKTIKSSELLKQLTEVESLQEKWLNLRDKVQREKVETAVLGDQLEWLQKEQDVVIVKCRTIGEDKTCAEKSEALAARESEIKGMRVDLERRRAKAAEFAKGIAKMKARAKSEKEQSRATDALIDELNSKLDEIVGEIETEVRGFDFINSAKTR
jgi:chromosome segregation ATPase